MLSHVIDIIDGAIEAVPNGSYVTLISAQSEVWEYEIDCPIYGTCF